MLKMLPFSMLDTHFNDRVHSRALCQINKSIVKLGNNKTCTQNIKTLSEVGFEPTPSYEDQNSHLRNLSESKVNLESGALDHSAILTLCFSLN